MRYFTFFCLFLICLGLGTAYASDSLQTQLRAAKHDSTRLHLYTALAINYRQNQFDSSLIYAKLGLELAQKLRTTRYSCQLYTCLGYYYRSQRQWEQSIKMLQLAIRFGIRNYQYPLVEIANYILAINYTDKAYNTGNKNYQSQAIRQVFENIRFSQAHRSFTQIDDNYSLLSAIYKNNGNDSLAVLYMEKQLPYLKKLKDTRNQLYFLVVSLQISLIRKNIQAAKKYLNEIIQFQYKPQDLGFYQYQLSVVTSELVQAKEYKQAFDLIQKIQADPRMVVTLDSHWKFQFNNDLATIYLYKKNYRLAQQAHKQAIYFSKKEVLPFGDRLKLLINQQQLLEHQKRFEEALKLNKRIHIMQDSLASARFEFELATSEERLVYENKERLFQQQLKIKQLENQRKTLALDNARQLQWVFTLLILFLVVVVAIIGLQMNKIKQQSTTLKKLNAAKNQLFAIIGHDLRSPILALQGALERISSSSTEIQTMLPRINSLLLTTDNLLYWAESQQNNAKYQPQNTAISDIIAEVLALLETSIEAAQLQIIDEVPDSVLVKADENHLRIIIRNVVQNAIKFTPTNGSIRFTTQQLAKATELRIEDTGIGYEQTQKENPFKSTQLGLKLVRNLIAINKGSFSIQNNNTQGTIVSIILPLPS